MKFLHSTLLLLAQLSCASALKVLLTNSDGGGSPGLVQMKTALEAAGHTVFVYAPAAYIPGSSAALTIPNVTVSAMSATEWAVEGTTSSAVLIGLSEMAGRATPEAPDLILSGIGSMEYGGGPSQISSGNIGSTLTGLGRGIPSIAVVTLVPADGSVTAEQHMTSVASYVVCMLGTLETAGTLGSLPDHTGFKVGYPPVAAIAGTRLATTSNYSPTTPTYTTSADSGVWQIANMASTVDTWADPESEEMILEQGFVAVTSIRNDIALPKIDYNVGFMLGIERTLMAMDCPAGTGTGTTVPDAGTERTPAPVMTAEPGQPTRQPTRQ